MSANDFNSHPYPFEGLINTEKGKLLDEDRTRTWIPNTTGRARGLLDNSPRVEPDPHAVAREVREMTKGKLGQITRLASLDVMMRTLSVTHDNAPTVGDGGREYAENTGKVKKALMSGIAALGLAAGAGLGLGVASDKLNNPDDNRPIPQMPYDGIDMLEGAEQLHNEPSRATIPVSHDEQS